MAYTTLLESIRKNPGYVFMRGVARFAAVRAAVTALKRASETRAKTNYRRELVSALPKTLFPKISREKFVAKLRRDGLSFGLSLPDDLMDEISLFASTNPVFAFRNPKLGFPSKSRPAATAALGKEILLAQYFNSQEKCGAIDRLANDPLLRLIALDYLGTVPRFLGAVLWWTYPVPPNRVDQMKHAHFFHRDVDDFKFMKFFFYLTDVEPGDGGHWAVSGSHRKAPHVKLKDKLITRRFEDSEIEGYYKRSKILEICGSRGTGFAEDTLCVHKASTPVRNPRLILQLQFGLFNFVGENDHRDPSELAMIPGLGDGLGGSAPKVLGTGRSVLT